ncbi:MAG: RNA polymerase sigma factor, partial [Nocardioidaceae bacterium]
MAGVLRNRKGGARTISAPPRPGTAGRSSGVHLSSRADRAADAALLVGYGLGDPSAATAFVRRFQGSVFGLALSITHDHALAEDVAQEAFAKAYRNFRQLRDRDRFRAWLVRLTWRMALDRQRANRRRLDK